MADGLGRLGAEIEVADDELVVHGGGPGSLRGATVQSHGDHRIAMAAAVAGLAATGETVVEGTDAIATSYPGFEAHLAVVADGAPSASVPSSPSPAPAPAPGG